MTNLFSQALSTKTPIAEINMPYVGRIVTEYLNGNVFYAHNPQYKNIVEAALALQEAMAFENYQHKSVITALMPDDDIALDKAVLLFNSGIPHVAFGLKKNNTPRDVSVNDFVTINYTALNEEAAVYGKVVKVVEYSLGWGLVIDPHETLNSFNIQRPHGWRYLSLWVAKDPTGQSGFIVSQTNRKNR